VIGISDLEIGIADFVSSKMNSEFGTTDSELTKSAIRNPKSEFSFLAQSRVVVLQLDR
jgi:hypothetical protein